MDGIRRKSEPLRKTNVRIRTKSEPSRKQEKHTLKLEENTSGETFQPKRQKNKVDNLSLRWSKRQPTKNELVEHFMELKSTTVIQQNSVLLMERRIVTLETDLRDLIEYINAKNV